VGCGHVVRVVTTSRPRVRLGGQRGGCPAGCSRPVPWRAKDLHRGLLAVCPRIDLRSGGPVIRFAGLSGYARLPAAIPVRDVRGMRWKPAAVHASLGNRTPGLQVLCREVRERRDSNPRPPAGQAESGTTTRGDELLRTASFADALSRSARPLRMVERIVQSTFGPRVGPRDLVSVDNRAQDHPAGQGVTYTRSVRRPTASF
jgi:hypothetical protein